MYTQVIVPSLPSGGRLDDQHQFSVIFPVERTNICRNPSFENNGTIGSDWTISASSTLTQSTDYQTHGLYSGKCAFNTSATAAVAYNPGVLNVPSYPVLFSAWVRAPIGKKLFIGWFNAGASVVRFPFVGTGDWQWVTGSYAASTPTASLALQIGKDPTANDTTAYTIYVDGVMIEAINSSENALTRDKHSTYIDGDQQGFLPTRTDYYWNGTAHDSTSTRIAMCRAGGVPLSLKNDLGFILTGLQGLGLAPHINATVSAGLVGGSLFQRATANDRVFTLIGAMRNESLDVLKDAKDLNKALNMLAQSPTQECLLWYQRWDDCGLKPLGPLLQIRCAFVGAGAGNNLQSLSGEDFDLRFEAYSPGAITKVWQQSTLFNEALSAGTIAGYLIAYNRLTQEWTRPYSFTDAPATSGTPSRVMCYAKTSTGADTLVYAGSAAGSWYLWLDGTQIVATPFNGRIRAVIADPNANGYVYVCGEFTTPQVRIARYQLFGLTAALGTGCNGTVYGIESDVDGSIVAVGAFPSAGGVASTSKVARWDGSTWVTILGGVTGAGNVYDLSIDNSSNIYVIGDATQYGTTTGITDAARYNSVQATWENINPGTALFSTPHRIRTMSDGRVLAGGLGTATASQDALAVYNGTSWSYLSVTHSTTIPETRMLLPLDNGQFWTGGLYNTLPGLALRDGLVLYQRQTPIRPTCNMFPAFEIVTDAVENPNKQQLLFQTAATGDLVSGVRTSMTNNGTARTYPTIRVIGPGTIIEIKNLSTNAALRFNYALLAGEVLDITLDPLRLSFISTLRGDISSALLSGSQESNWLLIPGPNQIHVFMSGSTSASKVYLQWRDTYASLGDAINGY